jgi:MerR family Zn(II)-responsive transcriptional regulator of zntA
MLVISSKTLSFLRPAELAHLCGLSTDTLRHYERKGLLHIGRSANGYREYPPEAQDRIRLVQNALSVGFTLDELARLLNIREKGGAPCGEVRALAAAKLKDLEGQLRSLSALRITLSKMLEQWDTKLALTRKGDQAHLLDMLQASTPGLKSPSPAAKFGMRRGRTRRGALAQVHSSSR